MTNEANGNPAPAGFPGVWAIAGTPVGEPYPCRCAERLGDACSAAWCPCAGRVDVLPAPCCSGRLGAAEHVEAQREWRIKRAEKKARELAQSGP